MIGPTRELPCICGQSVLIVESNALIALDLAATLGGWGAEPVIYYDLADSAQSAASSMVSVALIDVPDNHQPLTGLIEVLQRRGVPTALTTACDKDIIGGFFPGMKIFDKPTDYSAMQQWFRAIAPTCACAG
jgi:hypothetical protein